MQATATGTANILLRLAVASIVGCVLGFFLGPLIPIGILFVVTAVRVGQRKADRLTPFTCVLWCVGAFIGWRIDAVLSLG